MVDLQPSSDLDDLFDFSVPSSPKAQDALAGLAPTDAEPAFPGAAPVAPVAPVAPDAPVYASRREAREAESRAAYSRGGHSARDADVVAPAIVAAVAPPSAAVAPLAPPAPSDLGPIVGPHFFATRTSPVSIPLVALPPAALPPAALPLAVLSPAVLSPAVLPPAALSAPEEEVMPSRSSRRAAEGAASARRDRGSASATTTSATVSAHAPATANASTPTLPQAPAARKLKRAEARLVRASAPRGPRKNPLSVLVTMAAVGGMFAVVGLPAYAMEPPVAGAPADTVAAGSLGSAAGEVAQSLVVSPESTELSAARDGYLATSPDDLAQMAEDALRAAQNEAYNLSGARELGDDYPWPYELRSYQGGGLSPLNYYYRECVDFVAWRLNRDAGSYSAPFKWVWSNLTPYGGNGGQWMYNWQQQGWTVSKTPIAGAVAYVGGNHVAYVKEVNDDGTVLLEEYNYVPGAYSQRTLPATSIVAFLYPPS